MIKTFMKTIVVLALVTFGGVVHAETWTGLGDGVSFEDALNWDPSTNTFAGTTRDINGAFTVTRDVTANPDRTFVQGGATLNVPSGSHSDGKSGDYVRNFVGNGSQGTVNMSGGTYGIGHVLAIGHTDNSDGTFNLTGGDLNVFRGGKTLVGEYGGIFSLKNSISIGGNASHTGVTGLMEVSGGSLKTRSGLVVAKNGTLSIVGSGASSILLGGSNDDPGWFGLSADGLLKASVDAGGITKIFVEDKTNTNPIDPAVELQAGSLLYLTNMTAYGGTWTLLEIEGTNIVDNGLALAPSVDTNIWSFAVDNSGVNGKLTITAQGDPVPVAPRELVGYWTFDETSGTVASNSASTGSALNGTVSGTAVWADGMVGGALEFNGTDTSVAIGDALESVSNELTIAFWCYGDPSLPNQMNAFSGGAGRDLNCHFPWSGGTYGRIYFDADSPDLPRDRLTKDIHTTDTLWGGWNHWVFTKNVTDGTMAMYVNGDTNALASGTGKTNHMAGMTSTGFWVGSDRGGSLFYNGLLDEFRVYNYEISTDEMFAISRPSWHSEAEAFSSESGTQTDDVDDIGGGKYLGWIDDGDWAEYTINVETTGLHRVEFRVAANGGGGSIDIISAGETLDSVSIGDTGGWQEWITISTYVEFSATGTQTLRLEFPNGGFNLNWFSYEPASDPIALTVGDTRNQMMRFGIDYERLWYWYGSGLADVPQWSVNDCNVDYVRTAMNSGYELDEGSFNLSAYSNKIIPMMTAMQNANPNIKWFASPRPLDEAKSGASWQPYPLWVTGATTYTSGDYDFNATKCAEYMLRYLLLMKSYGFKITYMDLTNEWQTNYASGGRIAPDDVVTIKQVFDDYLVSPWPHPALSSSLLLEADDFPMMIGASSWSYSQGTSWISKFTTAERQNAIDIASSHNTDRSGSAQAFADQVHTTLGADTEIWQTEQHGWKGNSGSSEAMSFLYMIESIRAGFTGINGWLAIGTVNQGHCYLLNTGGTVTRNVKYYMFKKLSNTSNYGYALDIDETDDLTSTMALIRDNLLTIWVINTSSESILAEFDLGSHVSDGSDIKWTRWDEDLSLDGDETPEGIEGVVWEANASSFTAILDGRAAYCIEIPLVNNEDNFPFVQAENYDSISGATDQSTYVTFNAGGSETSYDLDIIKTYPHDVAFRVSSESANIAFDIYDGTTLIGSVNRMATGGAGNWTTIYQTFPMDGGPMNLRIVAQNGGWNLDWIKFDQQHYAIGTDLENIALNQPTSASNVHSSGYEADKAVDGDLDTRWATSVLTPWLEVDFGTPTLVNGVSFQEYNNRTTGYEIQCFDGTWNTVFVGGNPVDGQVYSFPSATGTRFRFQVTAATANPTFQEVEFFGGTAPPAALEIGLASVSVAWQGSPGMTYALQRSTNLVDGFTTIESGIPVHEGTNMNTMATPDDSAFYRVILE